MLIPECLIRQIVKTWKQLQTIPNSILRPAAGDIWDSAWRLRWNGDDKADRQQKIAYGHYSALQLWIQKNGRCNIREMMVEWLLWQWQKHVPLPPAKSAATGERFGVWGGEKRSSPWQHWLASSWRTTAFWPRHPDYGEIWWNCMKSAWCLGKKKKLLTFFWAVFPAIWRPMSSFANGSFLGPRIAPTLHGSQASLKCTRFLKWRDLKIIQDSYLFQ